MQSEWELVQKFIVQVDARLHAFTDRQIKYFVQDESTCYKVHAVMLVPLLEQAGMLTMTLSKVGLRQTPAGFIERVAHTYVDYWMEKIKVQREWSALDVVLDGPPSWAAVPK